jgi:preprotein translocase subunit SecY
MFATLRNAWKTKEIRKKILYTILLLVIYRVGSVIPVPGVNASAVAASVSSYDILGFLNLLSGGAFEKYTVFAMGISPYISASIILNLLTVAIPALERLSKQEDGPKKIERITRITGIGLALVQAIGITLGMGSSVVHDTSWFNYATIGIIMTAGTAFLMWLGERITDIGIGNGISLLIFTSIISSLPRQIITIVSRVSSGLTGWWVIIAIIAIIAVMIIGVTFIDLGVRRVSVQYAKRVVGRKMYGGQNTHIPLKVNASGVMPLIFAMTLIQFPAMIAQFWPDSAFTTWYTNNLGTGTVVYYIVFALLILGLLISILRYRSTPSRYPRTCSSRAALFRAYGWASRRAITCSVSRQGSRSRARCSSPYSRSFRMCLQSWLAPSGPSARRAY